MRHNVKTTNTSAGPEVTSYLEKKIVKLDDFIGADDTAAFADVELERLVTHSRGEEYRAEFTIHSSAGDYRAEALGTTMLSAIDGAVANASREMRRDKRKGLRFSRLQGLKVKNILRGWPFRRG